MSLILNKSIVMMILKKNHFLIVDYLFVQVVSTNTFLMKY